MRYHCLFFKDLFIYMDGCLPVSMSVHQMCAWCPQRSKMGLRLAGVTMARWVLGLKQGSSARTARLLTSEPSL